MWENEKVKLGLKIAGNALFALCLVLAIVATFLTLGGTQGEERPPSIFGRSALVVVTDSMEPTLKVGDIIFINQNVETFEEDDIVTFFMTAGGERVLNTHRIVGESSAGFITQGDNEDLPDAIHRTAGELVGTYTGVRIPVLGHVINFATTSVGFFILIVIPLFGYFTFHVVKVILTAKEYNVEKSKEVKK